MSDEHRESDLLVGKVAVVTGSTQGIGAGIALKLAAHGARVLIHGLDRHRVSGEEIVRKIAAAGGKARLMTGDLREEQVCRAIIAKALEHFERVDILVNNAAMVDRANIEDATTRLWDDLFAVNVRAVFLLCQEAVRHMKERKSGCIVNIGSGNGYCGLKKLLPYSASKGALLTFTRNLANYLTKYRIRVNQVNPGWTLTEGEQHAIGVMDQKGENWLEAAEKTRPHGRMLLPADIAGAVLFFATNELVSGAVLDYEQFPFIARSDREIQMTE